MRLTASLRNKPAVSSFLHTRHVGSVLPLPSEVNYYEALKEFIIAQF